MCNQREGSLSVLEEGGTAGDLEFKLEFGKIYKSYFIQKLKILLELKTIRLYSCLDVLLFCIGISFSISISIGVLVFEVAWLLPRLTYL